MRRGERKRSKIVKDRKRGERKRRGATEKNAERKKRSEWKGREDRVEIK